MTELLMESRQQATADRRLARHGSPLAVSNSPESAATQMTEEEIAMPTAVEDKDAIREVLAEYCFRLDDGRFAEMAALFTEDGTWDTAFGKATGRAAIAELASSLRTCAEQPRPPAVHLVTNIAIALDGARAQIRSNWMVTQNSPQGPRIGSGGAYIDDIVMADGRWLFRYRKLHRPLTLKSRRAQAEPARQGRWSVD
jgi:hypothetical protein